MSNIGYGEALSLREATIDFTMDKIIDELDGEVFKEGVLGAAWANAKYTVPRFTTEELVRVRFALRVINDVLSDNYGDRRRRSLARWRSDRETLEQAA
jgi:hypothetical protein